MDTSGSVQKKRSARVGFEGAGQSVVSHPNQLSGHVVWSYYVPPSTYAVHCVGPGRPCLVRTCTMPFAAAVPYNVPAEGPFTASIASRSSGWMSLMRDGFCPPTPTVLLAFPLVPLLTRMPSMKNTGSFDSDTLLEPRIRTREPPPVVPLEGITVTPAARAFRRSAKLVIAVFGVFSTLMWDTSVGCVRSRCCSPLAVTMLASSPT